MYINGYSCQILMQVGLSLGRFFWGKKNLKCGNYEHTFSGSRVIPCERMDKETERHDEAKIRFSRF